MTTSVSFGQSQDANNNRAAKSRPRSAANKSVDAFPAADATSLPLSWQIQIPRLSVATDESCQKRLRVLANQLGLRLILDPALQAATCAPEHGNADEQFISLVKQAGWHWTIVAPGTVRVSIAAVESPVATIFLSYPYRSQEDTRLLIEELKNTCLNQEASIYPLLNGVLRVTDRLSSLALAQRRLNQLKKYDPSGTLTLTMTVISETDTGRLFGGFPDFFRSLSEGSWAMLPTTLFAALNQGNYGKGQATVALELRPTISDQEQFSTRVGFSPLSLGGNSDSLRPLSLSVILERVWFDQNLHGKITIRVESQGDVLSEKNCLFTLPPETPVGVDGGTISYTLTGKRRLWLIPIKLNTDKSTTALWTLSSVLFRPNQQLSWPPIQTTLVLPSDANVINTP
jgi:hypothetical protein